MITPPDGYEDLTPDDRIPASLAHLQDVLRDPGTTLTVRRMDKLRVWLVEVFDQNGDIIEFMSDENESLIEILARADALARIWITDGN